MDLHEHVGWLDTQLEPMTELLRSWADINSGSRNLSGLERMRDAISTEFSSLGGDSRFLQIPDEETIDSRGKFARHQLGNLIRITKRSDAPIRVLLNIHYDTVYHSDHPFQLTRRIDADTMNGPGVADAKGGLVVMLFALRAFEQSALSGKLGWEILINPDEEIGSPGSAASLREAAQRNQVGLLFEPAMPDGSLVGARKGSGNFTIIVHGRAAHAGRDFHHGRSAILALAELILKIDQAQQGLPNVTINCGRVEGGGALNIVPELAIGRFNARVSDLDEQREVELRIAAAVDDEVRQHDGIKLDVHGGFHAPPKPLDATSARLMDQILLTASELGLNLTHKPSGGASDGNKLAAAGLPLVDTLGPVGGHLHSDQEYVKLSTLLERARLTTLVLLKIASGQIDVT